MPKIAFFLSLALPLFAGFFPETVHTSITSATAKTLQLKNPFAYNGMSGIVTHQYGSKLQAITSRIVQVSKSKMQLLKGDMVNHDNLPTINTSVQTGDKVIGGYLYDNVLLLAPDAQTYKQLTSTYTKNWIHPDLFAMYLSNIGDKKPTKENLASFAKTYQVGLICIVSQNSLKLLDPISGKVIRQKSMSGLPNKGKSPFFMRLDKIDSGMFSSSTTQSYYDIMKSL